MELGYNTVGLIRKFESIGIYPLYHRCASVKYLIIENISSLEVYDGSARIVSKLGEGTFVHKNTGIMAGGIDYIRQSAQMQEARDRYIKGSLTPPGPPTQHGIYASPEWTGQPYPSLGWQNIRQDQEPPEGWPRPPKFNEPGDVPGPPVQYGDPITPQTVKAGYGFIDNGIIEKNLYFYHPDHLGSSSYITDREGRITQHTEYIAFGEVLFEEHSTSRTMPYLFNGKELDTETGLYYYGARYYDPRVSLWLNVDPLAEKTMTPYAYTNNNPINLIDPTGKFPILINGRVSNDSERGNPTYWSRNIREIIKRRTGYNYSKFKYVDGDRGIFPNTRKTEGLKQGKADAISIYNKLKESIKDGMILVTSGGTTIFANCNSCLNPGSLYKNLFGLSYPGGNNPRTYGGNYSYEYIPKYSSEYPAIRHNRRYDNLRIEGAKGLLTDKRAIGADWRFVLEKFAIANNVFNIPIDKACSKRVSAKPASTG